MLYYFLRVTVLVTLVEPFARVVRVTRVVVLPVLLTLTVLRNTLDITILINYSPRAAWPMVSLLSTHVLPAGSLICTVRPKRSLKSFSASPTFIDALIFNSAVALVFTSLRSFD